MISLLFRFIALVVLASLLAWMADQPGNLKLQWLGHEIETSLMAAAIILIAVLLIIWIIWSVLMWLLDRPGAFGGWFKSRRQRKGREALSSGLIAVAAGDKDAAQAHAKTAVSVLGDDPMVQLLDAQAAQLRGDNAKVREIFEDMATKPDTRLLGLRGLHTDAVRQSDTERAKALAEEAAKANPKLSWASSAVLSHQSANEDWAAISQTIDNQKSAKLITASEANVKHAAALTAQAMNVRDENPELAGDLALRAHKKDPALVPAAVMAAHHAANNGSLRKASKIIEKTWGHTPHPDLGEAYSHVRSGDSAQDRLKRISSLVKKGGGIEAAIVLATAAIEALEWKQARKALEPYAHDRPQARICGLMAEIEEGEFGDKGRAREWLSRAVRAPRDPAWTADGHISSVWRPVSPVTGELGAFEWKVPVEGIAYEPVEEPEMDDETEVIPGDDAVPIESVDETATETDDEADEVEPDSEDEATDPEEVDVEDAEDVTEAEAEAEPETENTEAEEVETPSQPEPEPETTDNEAEDEKPATLPRQPDDPGTK